MITVNEHRGIVMEEQQDGTWDVNDTVNHIGIARGLSQQEARMLIEKATLWLIENQ